jgi:hypothetical protein
MIGKPFIPDYTALQIQCEKGHTLEVFEMLNDLICSY